MVFLVLAAKELALFFTTLLAIKLWFSKAFLNPSNALKLKKKSHLMTTLKSSYKLCTPILASLPLIASTKPPKNAKKHELVQGSC